MYDEDTGKFRGFDAREVNRAKQLVYMVRYFVEKAKLVYQHAENEKICMTIVDRVFKDDDKQF